MTTNETDQGLVAIARLVNKMQQNLGDLAERAETLRRRAREEGGDQLSRELRQAEAELLALHQRHDAVLGELRAVAERRRP